MTTDEPLRQTIPPNEEIPAEGTPGGPDDRGGISWIWAVIAFFALLIIIDTFPGNNTGTDSRPAATTSATSPANTPANNPLTPPVSGNPENGRAPRTASNATPSTAAPARTLSIRPAEFNPASTH